VLRKAGLRHQGLLGEEGFESHGDDQEPTVSSRSALWEQLEDVQCFFFAEKTLIASREKKMKTKPQ